MNYKNLFPLNSVVNHDILLDSVRDRNYSVGEIRENVVQQSPMEFLVPCINVVHGRDDAGHASQKRCQSSVKIGVITMSAHDRDVALLDEIEQGLDRKKIEPVRFHAVQNDDFIPFR